MSGFTINHVTISGNIVRDPEVRAMPSGKSVCDFAVAVNENVPDGAGGWTERASFIDVTVFGGIGEWIGRSLRKGDGIAVSGRLRQDRWQAQDGGNRSKVKIVAESIMPRSSGNGQPARQAQEPMAGAYEPPHEQPVGSGFPGDDIPF